LRHLTLRFLCLSLLLATRLLAQPSSPSGHWEGSIKLPGAELTLQVFLEERGGAWSGTISIPQQGAKDLPLARIRSAQGSVEFAIAAVPGEPFFKGTLGQGGRIEGTFTQGGQSFPYSLHRPGAKVPAPEARKDPQDRDISFPGFNGLTLKGSVRNGAGHSHFVVMVAGSGPTDRDWSNPVIPSPSHGGRDFAAWLQKQGIGSLRYDKRGLGVRDPKFDFSLDAQSGDVAGALRAARSLPEAKGRKLLLVGHSEGTILALLNPKDADALLLLAMPGQSLAVQVLEQVRNQFIAVGAVEQVAKPNLDHLAAVLEAIRRGRELPLPGESVVPNVAALGNQLARPGTLGFFKAIMDLDPWQLASRVAVPLAAVWGDRDVQCWKPAIPASFKGTVIDLPGANHLLKQESRSSEELNPALAISAYGDDTPLADLAPLAGWLKSLK
jgi:pimeloyl-ACP methyl ester carboxylesterase